MNFMINCHYCIAFVHLLSVIVSNHYLWTSLVIVLQVLGQLDGDVDSAIAYMIAERFAMSSDNVDGDPYMDYACNGRP